MMRNGMQSHRTFPEWVIKIARNIMKNYLRGSHFVSDFVMHSYYALISFTRYLLVYMTQGLPLKSVIPRKKKQRYRLRILTPVSSNKSSDSSLDIYAERFTVHFAVKKRGVYEPTIFAT